MTREHAIPITPHHALHSTHPGMHRQMRRRMTRIPTTRVSWGAYYTLAERPGQRFPSMSAFWGDGLQNSNHENMVARPITQHLTSTENGGIVVGDQSRKRGREKSVHRCFIQWRGFTLPKRSSTYDEWGSSQEDKMYVST